MEALVREAADKKRGVLFDLYGVRSHLFTLYEKKKRKKKTTTKKISLS